MWSSHQRSKGYFTAGVESKGQPWIAPVWPVGLINLFHKCENDWSFSTLAKTVQLVCINRDEFCSQSLMCNKSTLIPLNSMEVIPNFYLWESCNLSMKCFQQNGSKSFASLHKLHNMPVKQVNAIQIRYIYISPIYNCINCSRRSQLLTMS